VKTADAGKSHNIRVGRWSSFQFSALWRILEDSVDSVRVVVTDAVSEKTTQMVLIEHDHVIDEFAFT